MERWKANIIASYVDKENQLAVIWDMECIDETLFVPLSTWGFKQRACQMYAINTLSHISKRVMLASDLDLASEPRFHSKVYMSLLREDGILYGATHHGPTPNITQDPSYEYKGGYIFSCSSPEWKPRRLGFVAERQGIRSLAKVPREPIFYAIAYPHDQVYRVDVSTNESECVAEVWGCTKPPYSIWWQNSKILWLGREGTIYTLEEKKEIEVARLPTESEGRCVGIMKDGSRIIRDATGTIHLFTREDRVVTYGKIDDEYLKAGKSFTQSILQRDSDMLISLPYFQRKGGVKLLLMRENGKCREVWIELEKDREYGEIYRLVEGSQGEIYAGVKSAAMSGTRKLEVLKIEN